MKNITSKTLKEWNACTDGFKGFCKLFPKGANLKDAMDGLIADGHTSWAEWLFIRCREHNLFPEIIAKGFCNAGDCNAGDCNAGNLNAGDWNAGDWNAGDCNAGDCNAGNWNAGNWNAGDCNAGNWNAGNLNAGDCNAGDWNAGNRNAGNWNAGNLNAGDWNAGNWNAGNRNAGCFNTLSPDEIVVFNKPCDYNVWANSYKPNFLYFDLCVWVYEHEMTDQEKIDHPKFYVAQGYIKKIDYKTAFQNSWNNADKTDREKVRSLPNFDAEIFFQISGIDLR